MDILSGNTVVEFKDKLWVFGEGRKVGDSPSPYCVLCSSDDGISWQSYIPPFSPRKTHAALVHNDKLFVIAASGFNDVWRTEDGNKEKTPWMFPGLRMGFIGLTCL